MERDTIAIVQALKRVEQPDEMEVGVTSLEQRQREARARLDELLKDVKKAPSRVENEPHQYTYKSSLHPEQDTVIASEESSRAGGNTPGSTSRRNGRVS